jgi:hypothetical protein
MKPVVVKKGAALALARTKSAVAESSWRRVSDKVSS